MLPEIGKTVEITGVMYDPAPLEVGLKGVVQDVNESFGQIYVDWEEDSRGYKRTLILLADDPFVVLQDG